MFVCQSLKKKAIAMSNGMIDSPIGNLSSNVACYKQTTRDHQSDGCESTGLFPPLDSCD